jgi:hypothetical protein
MPSSKTRFTAAALLFFTLTGSAWSLPPRPSLVTPSQHESVREFLWTRLLSLLERIEGLTATPGQPAVPQKEGPQMDPNGGH